jgi:SRSO17 transposase
MLSSDGSDFVKKGKHSAGVKRQYCGRLGKVDNCQAGVFVAYASKLGYGLVDRELYLPKEWLGETHGELRKKCGIPDTKAFKTKNQIALDMIHKAAAKNIFDIKWIGCDAAFGCDHAFVDALPKSAYYFVGTNCKERVFLPDTELLRSVKELADNDDFPWQKIGLAGSKGTVNSDVKIIRRFACRTHGNKNIARQHDEIWLYIRRYKNGDTKYYLTNAPKSIDYQEPHEAVQLRWPIEQCFEECKSYLGMADFEGRSYNGFLRHLPLVMIAHFFGTSLRLELKKTAYP